MSKLIENLKWRYATKKFDSNKKVSEQDLETLMEALQLSASSYGMQFYKFLLIKNTEIRKQLMAASWGQKQVIDASDLILMCSIQSVNDADVDVAVANTGEVRDIPVEKLTAYANFVKSKVNELNTSEKQDWAAKQVYTVLGFALSACADLRIDSCPMEGFDPQKYDEILGLSAKGLIPTLVLPIGYRSENDKSQYDKKVRKSTENLFEIID